MKYFLFKMLPTRILINTLHLIRIFSVDLLGSNGRVEEALDLLKESLKTVQLQDYPVASLINLKNLAEADDKKFPYGIPPSSESGRRRSFL